MSEGSRLRRVGRALRRTTVRGLKVLVPVVVAASIGWPMIRPRLIDRARFVQYRDGISVVDREGRPLRLTRPEGEDRRWVALEDMSPNLVEAFVAIEDADFREHEGVDLGATARAALAWALPNRRISGASTITQQTVKLVYGRPHGLWDKPVEILRALALEDAMTKDEILEQYLNRVPFGDRIVGVGRASQAYFGKPASALTLAEAALLAGVPQAPSATEPRRHLPRAMRRRATVLARMLATGRIERADHDAALATTPHIETGSTRPWHAPRFVDRVVDANRRGNHPVRRGVIETSLDLELQRATRAAVQTAVRRYADRGVTNGAAIVLDHRTGEVLAYVGAADQAGSGGALDLLRAPRQPGSSLKPFVYELLFEQGGTAATVLDDIARPMVGGDGAIFEAEDYDGRERGPVRARIALASSLNLAAIDAARRVGAARVVERLGALGIRGLGDPSEYGAAIALGGPDVRPVDLARAYATLARGGSPVALRFDKGHGEGGPAVMDEGAAAITLDVLRDGDARRDAFGADLEDLAGGAFGLKTGTSSGWHDAWASAIGERHTVVVWLGDPDGGALAEVAGFEAAAPVAATILGSARARGPRDDESPVAMVTHHVCPLSGAFPGPGCGAPVPERFVEGTMPEGVCPFHDAQGVTHLPPRYGRWVETVQRAETRIRAVETRRHRLELAFPSDGDEVVVDPQAAPTWRMRARRGTVEADARFEVDGVLMGSEWRVRPGDHQIVAIADGERSSAVQITVHALSRVRSRSRAPFASPR